MRQFRLVQPDDAEVLRDSRWVRYDPCSLVVGDVIRLAGGDGDDSVGTDVVRKRGLWGGVKVAAVRWGGCGWPNVIFQNIFIKPQS